MELNDVAIKETGRIVVAGVRSGNCKLIARSSSAIFVSVDKISDGRSDLLINFFFGSSTKKK